MTIIQLIRKNQIHFSEDNKIETWKNNNISKTGYFLKNSSWNIELNAFTALFIFNGKENILIEEINKNAKMIIFFFGECELLFNLQNKMAFLLK